MKCGHAPFTSSEEGIEVVGRAEGGRYDRGSSDRDRHPLLYGRKNGWIKGSVDGGKDTEGRTYCV
jgi:hypothetical protein